VTANSPRIAVFASFSGQGGVERMVTNLLPGFVAAGVEVDLVLVKAISEHLQGLPNQVNVIELGSKHTLTSLPALIRYLRRRRPVAMLAAKHRAIKTAVLARRLSGIKMRLVGRLGTTVSAALEGRGRLRMALWRTDMRIFYRGVDLIVAVSAGVAADVRELAQLSESRLQVIRNPVVTPELAQLAAQPVDHPWFAPGQPPVIVAAGRLTRQKDFPTLIRAFAKVHQTQDCRLVILGEGKDRVSLETLATELEVGGHVELAGFKANPYPFLARCALFVLSSRWEGSPNVLTEAMALGRTVVATDCPSGPREVLAEGRLGALVPVGDDRALAQAIGQALRTPADPQQMRDAVRDYHTETSARAYLSALGVVS
jgi:glycosyltransferase involved in cell wall biosynthesis